MLQIDHLKGLCTNGIYKTDIPGAVLVAPKPAPCSSERT